MHQIPTVHGEIGDKERWGMDGPVSVASRPGGGRSGEVDGGVAASQGFYVSSSFPLRFCPLVMLCKTDYGAVRDDGAHFGIGTYTVENRCPQLVLDGNLTPIANSHQ
uniref:Uncharacterized protein n=1 Tax=Oryza meridionalis TaxID=40149 RepID=A0A0E0CUC7_9ORYZ